MGIPLPLRKGRGEFAWMDRMGNDCRDACPAPLDSRLRGNDEVRPSE